MVQITEINNSKHILHKITMTTALLLALLWIRMLDGILNTFFFFKTISQLFYACYVPVLLLKVL